jgi:hypothetical protein
MLIAANLIFEGKNDPVNISVEGVPKKLISL